MSEQPDLASRFTSRSPGQEAAAPSITIQGVPASVTRAALLAAIESLGIDPNQVCELRFDLSAIEVEVFSDGKPDVPGWRWTHNGKDVATHRLTIPIVDAPSPSGA